MDPNQLNQELMAYLTQKVPGPTILFWFAGPTDCRFCMIKVGQVTEGQMSIVSVEAEAISNHMRTARLNTQMPKIEVKSV